MSGDKPAAAAKAETAPATMPAPLEGWAALQAPFDADSVSLLPRATGDKDKRHKQKCDECHGYHEFPCIHLAYVGHADITMRLNEVDPEWTWEPMGHDANGLPALDANGGLWAWLTILGSRKPAYGDPGLNYKNESKKATPDGMKEAIGDMLRNGAMRFGVGTALWSKSDKAKATLLPDDDAPNGNGGKTYGASGTSAPAAPEPTPDPAPAPADPLMAALLGVIDDAKREGHTAELHAWFDAHGGPNTVAWGALSDEDRDEAAWVATNGESLPADGEEIPF